MHDPAGRSTEKLYAWMAEDADGEGIVGVHSGAGRWLQLVGTDRATIESYRSVAEQVAHIQGPTCKVRLKMFSGGVVIDKI